METAVVNIFVFVLCYLVFGASAQNRIQELREMTVECNLENEVPPNEWDLIKTGQLDSTKASKNLKCSSKCIMIKAGYMNETGYFNIDPVMADFGREQEVVRRLQKCQALENDDLCTKAFMITYCLHHPNKY